jgi:hypothetical protein
MARTWEKYFPKVGRALMIGFRPRTTVLSVQIATLIIATFGAPSASLAANRQRQDDLAKKYARLQIPQFQKLESLRFDEVCGLGIDGQTVCYNANGGPTWIPDTVGKLQTAFQNDFFGCGEDEDGWKCWSMEYGSDGIIKTNTIVRNFLAAISSDMMQVTYGIACAEDNQTKELVCMAPYWNNNPKLWRRPVSERLSAIGVHPQYVCWGDADKIHCENENSLWQPPTAINLVGLKEIKLGPDFLCARSENEAKCWSEKESSRTIQSLPVEFVDAKSWHARYDALCALTKDLSLKCLDPRTGIELDPQLNEHFIPAEFRSPNPDIRSAWFSFSWTSNDRGCVLKTDGNVQCWMSSGKPLVFKGEFFDTVDRFLASPMTFCGMLRSGQIECPLIERRSLPKTTRIRIEIGGNFGACAWNEGGVNCVGRYSELVKFESIRNFTMSKSYDGSTCLIGIELNSPFKTETIRCLSYDPAIEAVPESLRNPTLVSVYQDRACAVADDGVTCWGKSFNEGPHSAPIPNSVMGAKKILVSESHGCLIDDFGFSCWGNLANNDLIVPADLERPGRVVDFALGRADTCAVLDSGEVLCWGRETNSSTLSVPKFENASSIIGSPSVYGDMSLFCAIGKTESGPGLHCWGSDTYLPQ